MPWCATGSTADPLPAFRERPPWCGGDLQTVRNQLLGRVISAGPAEPDPTRSRRLAIAMPDGSGDRLAARFDPPRHGRPAPTVVLIHGLAGCEESAYARASAAHLTARGYGVLRVNLRGAGPSRPLCRLQYHAGRSADLDALLARLPAELAAGGMAAVGYSLGGNVLLKYLGEAGDAAPLAAAVSVSAPIDLAATARRMMAPRNALYHRWLLRLMKRESLAAGADLTRAERQAIAEARTVYAFDDRFVAPRNGFASADDYYARCAAQRYLAGIRVPTLLLHAANDPWIPADAYRRVDWSAMPRLRPAIAPGGGHVGFHGRGSPVPWHDRCIAAHLDVVFARPWIGEDDGYSSTRSDNEDLIKKPIGCADA